jgi:hypothetical protein
VGLDDVHAVLGHRFLLVIRMRRHVVR